MKTLKLLVFNLSLVLASTSCTQNEDLNSELLNTTNSPMAKTITETVKTSLNADGTYTDPSSMTTNFGFEFVFPVTFKYNNDTKVIVKNSTDLATVVFNMTASNYIDGIHFPFEIKKEGVQQTLQNELELSTIINSYDTDNDGVPNYEDDDDSVEEDNASEDTSNTNGDDDDDDENESHDDNEQH